jgi:spore coat protein U-like protein
VTRRAFTARKIIAALAWAAAAATARADCSLSSAGVAFGAYDPLASAPVESAGTIGINCSPATSYAIALSAGNGTFDARLLRSGASALGYNLYTDPARTTVWGDGTGTSMTVSGSGTGASYPVYGRIPARQNVPAGSYADTITVTVTF